jgi:hypothetical protein
MTPLLGLGNKRKWRHQTLQTWNISEYISGHSCGLMKPVHSNLAVVIWMVSCKDPWQQSWSLSYHYPVAPQWTTLDIWRSHGVGDHQRGQASRSIS